MSSFAEVRDISSVYHEPITHLIFLVHTHITSSVIPRVLHIVLLSYDCKVQPHIVWTSVDSNEAVLEYACKHAQAGLLVWDHVDT